MARRCYEFILELPFLEREQVAVNSLVTTRRTTLSGDRRDAGVELKQ